jgi:signal transduction histidine kinase/ligand-binding sensor domain-containing protein
MMVLGFASATLAAATNSAWFAHVWDSEGGLPDNNVIGVAQTPDGYLWVATPSGLARFDGIRFQDFSPTNFPGVPNRVVRALLGSRTGGLWLAMDRGPVVGVNAGIARVFTAANGLPDLVAQTLVEGGDGALWITYAGGTVCRIQDGRVTFFAEQDGLPAGPVCSLARDNQGRVWFAKGNQIGMFRDGRFQTLLRVGKLTTRLGTRQAGGVWICSDTRLFQYDEGSPLKDLGAFQPERPGAEPTVLLEDHNGAVWMGTSASGLFRYDGVTFENVATSHREIASLAEDREGNLWVGTGGGGLNQLQPRAVELEGAQAGLPFEAVQSICEDGQGVLWAATQNGLLVCRTDGRWHTASTNANWPGGGATCVTADRAGAVWIGTRDRQLYCWREGHFSSWGKTEGLEGQTIHTLLVSTSGDLWIGEEGPNAVQCLRAGQLRSFKLPPDIRLIRAMAEDAAGRIWIGTSKGVLLCISGDQLSDETAHTSPSLLSIRCLAATPDGTLWIGYAGWGVGRLKEEHYARIHADQGLYDDYVSQIVVDGQGWLWFGANHGIFKVRQQELDAVAEGRATRVRSIHYGRGEGLPSLQANYGESPGALRSRDGRLWIPMRTALAVVHPDKLHKNTEPPPVLIERVGVDGRSVAWYGSVLPVPEVDGRKILDLRAPRAGLRLHPQHRKLEFEFTALSFVATENVHFRYQLEGLDEDWLDAGTQRSVSYSRLAAGDYRFRVKACNNDGVWTETGATLGFTVAPFAWQTWWFRLSTLAGFTASVVAIVRYVSFRRLRLKLRVLEQQAALYKERARIAKDIHDDLGGSLTQISLLSELARQDSAAPDKTEEHVRHISTTARQVIKSLDEIVWAVNPRNDTLPHLIDYIGQFAVEFLRAANIRCRVDLPDHPPQQTVSAEARHNLFLAMKEALNNVVRHTRASEVWLRVSITEESLRMAIEDNGQGFAHVPDNAHADGLRNMRQRMEEIGGQFHLESQPQAGTRISLLLPWRR